MQAWLDEFNATLEPKGIFVKGFVFGKMQSGGQGSERSSKNLSVLVFALTRMEIKRVRDEPVLQAPPGDKDYNCWHCTAHHGRAI
eukprot:1260401-Rhodomonas_salina.2